MRVFSSLWLLIAATACGSGTHLKEQIDVTLAARATPPVLPVPETTTITVRAWYPQAFDSFSDDAYVLVGADIRIASMDPETLRAVGGIDMTQHRWNLEMPVTTQTEQFGFECVREGAVEVVVGTMEGDALRPAQTLIIQCTSAEPRYVSWLDDLRDLIDSISTDRVERDDFWVDLSEVFAVLHDDADPPREAFACSDPNVTCSGDLGDGPLIHTGVILDGPVPDDADHFLVYALVGQRDEDPANDWVPQSPFDWDLFQQTDWWLQLIYDPLSGWRLEGTRVLADQSTEPFMPNVMVVRQGARLDFFVPLADLALPFRFRMTAFAAGDSTYPQDDRGGDVPGADPTEPLLVLE